MIKGILFAVFFVLMAVSIGLLALFITKIVKSGNSEAIDDLNRAYRNKMNSWRLTDTEKEQIKAKYQEELAELKARNPKGHKVGLIAGICLFIASLALVITIPGSFHQVEAGSYAVVKEVGKIIDVRQPGTYFDFYMTRKYEVYDATVQQVKINTQAYSKDGQTMDLEVYLQYQIQLDKLIVRDSNGNIVQTDGIAGRYITLDSLQARIETQTIEKTKAVMSSAEAMTIIQNRAQFSADVSAEVRNILSNPDENYYVNVQDVVLTNIDFTDEFEKSVEDKVIAEQNQIAENTKAETAKQVAITHAEAELEVAKLEAQKKIEQARGDAEAQKILAKAAAEAATYKIIELARTIGYTVNETYVYSVDGVETEFDTKQAETETVIYLGTKYVIDIKSGPGEANFKTLVEDYLQYLAYLEKWNGELPDVVAGDEAISIIVPNN